MLLSEGSGLLLEGTTVAEVYAFVDQLQRRLRPHSTRRLYVVGGISTQRQVLCPTVYRNPVLLLYRVHGHPGEPSSILLRRENGNTRGE